MVKYERHEPIEGLDDINPTKILLRDGGEMPENIWCKRAGGHVVLMNHALAFHPFPSWGLVMPAAASLDAKPIKDADPSVLRVIPEAYDNMVALGFILADGTINPDYRDPSEIDHAPENEFEVEIGGFYLYDGERLESAKSMNALAVSMAEGGTEKFRLLYKTGREPLMVYKLEIPLRWALSKKTEDPRYNAYTCYYDTRNGSLDGVVEALAFNSNLEDPMYTSLIFRDISQ